MVISDTQFPFEHRDTFSFLKAVKNRYKTDTTVHIGDELDFHCLSTYDPDPDGFSSGHELEKGLESMRKLYALFPECSVVFSNHTSRPFKRAFKAGIPRAFLRDYSEFLQAPKGWKWAETWEIDGVVYEHGEGVSGPDAARRKAMYNMKPTVIGHIHSHAGIMYINNGTNQIWGFNSGCLIDFKSYSYLYAKHHPQKPVISLGVVDRGVPHLYPMTMDKHGRWDGNL